MAMARVRREGRRSELTDFPTWLAIFEQSRLSVIMLMIPWHKPSTLFSFFFLLIP
jgi:hypothetical protein